MTTHIRGFTYEPKIAAVLNDTCRQTIRAGNKIKVGDKILFHGWEGKPYRSKWSWRKEVKVVDVFDIIIHEEGIFDAVDDDGYYHWNTDLVNTIAANDGIEPATGEALKEVLFKYNGVPGKDGTRCQIIRW